MVDCAAKAADANKVAVTTETAGAYFFQNDNLIVPADFSDQDYEKTIPLKYIECFIDSRTFKINSINEINPSIINVVSIPSKTTLPDNWKSIHVRQLFTSLTISSDREITGNANSNIAQIIRACHIAQWRNESCFCGTCGAENNEVSKEAFRSCPSCGRLEFPRVSPAVITIVTDSENRILLARNKKFKTGVYSHIAGFNEAGENLEETVAREIREEVNINVKNIKYVKSQPWPFPNSLMIGFKAQYLSGAIRPDGDEIEDAKWFTKDNLPALPGKGSLSRVLIDEWLFN
ncbi:MAG: NAD(+) diphosphatase [Treponema sp.]|nr:NAD(+) diphosphatase [Treponema sp.]